MADLHELATHGQSIWLDYIKRSFTRSGKLGEMLDRGIRGITSNPAIFKSAIDGSADYQEDIVQLAAEGLKAVGVYEALAIADIQEAADRLRPLYDATDGRDGFVSLEVSPLLAHDTESTIAEAIRLHGAVGRPNLMVKIPATPEGIPAIEAVIAQGIHVNVTLIFSLAQYEQAAHAYLAGLEKQAVDDLSATASVASVFVSRVDTAVDARIEKEGKLDALRGKLAVDNARLIYVRFKEIFSGPRWEALSARGARVQRPLWASTGTKNPDYPDTLYVDTLIGPDTVNTAPLETIEAFADHGTLRDSVEDDLDGARARMAELDAAGWSGPVFDALLQEGVQKFEEAYNLLIQSIEKKLAT